MVTDCVHLNARTKGCALHRRCRWLDSAAAGGPDLKACVDFQAPAPTSEIDDLTEYCPCAGKPDAPTAAPGVAVGASSPRQSIEWISTAQLAADSVRLASMVPRHIDAIAGIPRSGMIAAAIVAAHLHLPLFELPEAGALRPIGHGSRGRPIPRGASRLLVIDDTVYGGRAMRLARIALRGRHALFAAIYCRPEARRQVDLFARLLPSPHLLEWNAFNNGPWAGLSADRIYGAGVATDFDGILCRDPELADADDGPGLDAYRQWLVRARPLWLPRAQPTRLIVTARLERFRSETEAWLRYWGVRWERLIMYPADRASQRQDVAGYKAEHFKASNCGLFFESDPGQAARIWELSRKPVACPPAGKVYQ